MKIAFIGGGNMGEAILAVVLGKGLSMPDSICVSDVSAERRRHLKSEYGAVVTGSNKMAILGKDVIVLAVKPQNLSGVMVELKGCLEPSQLVLSVIAGASLSTICQGLGHSHVVRAMPNTPARIGAGISAWTAAVEVNEEQQGWSRSILTAMGKQICFDNEKYLDMATAVSGSGPAYFFLLAESLVNAAVNIGLPRNEAEELVLATMLGSAQLLQKSGETPAELRRGVTSPGGTTAQALSILEGAGFPGLIEEAVRAAYHRAKELVR